MLNFRSNTALQNNTASGNASVASGWRVYPCPVGGVAASNSTGTTITFSAPHSFAIGDRPLRNPGTDNEFLSGVSAITRFSITLVSSSPTVSTGDVFVNLGPDTGTTAPNYDAIRFGMYEDGEGTTAETEVTTGASGTYEYWHRGSGLHWELFVNSGSPIGVVKGIGEAQHYNIADFGAVIDGTTDDTTAVAATAIAADELGTIYFPQGTTVASGVTLGSNIDSAPDAVIQDDTVTNGTCVTVRRGTGNTNTLRTHGRLPKIEKTTRAWTITGVSGSRQANLSTDIGLKFINVQIADYHIPYVQNFSLGVQFTGESAGIVHCKFVVDSVSNCPIPMQLYHTGSGFVNSNSFHGGRINALSNADDDGTNPITNVRCIDIKHETDAQFSCSQNSFYDFSFEDDAPEFHLYCDGSDSWFQNIRWETNSPNLPKVRFGAVTAGGAQAATRNKIVGGYDTAEIVKTEDATCFANDIISGRYVEITGQPAPAAEGVLQLMNVTTGQPSITMFEGNANGMAGVTDKATDWTAAWSDQEWELKQSGDANPRIQINDVGRIRFGNGTDVITNGTSLWRPSTDQLRTDAIQIQQVTANGARMNRYSKEVVLTLTGATPTASAAIIAGSHLIGWAARVTTAITTIDGATDWDLGDGSNVDILIDGGTMTDAIGTTYDLRDGDLSIPGIYTTNTDIVASANGGTFDTGEIRIVLFYDFVSAPTS